MLADTAPWGKVFLNRRGNVQMLAIADDAVAVAVVGTLQSAGKIARSKHADMVEPQAVAAGDAIDVADTPSIALGRCGTAVAAQNFGFLAQGPCMATDCRKQRDSGTQTVEAAAEGDMQVAVVERAVLADNPGSVHGYTVNVVVVHLAEEVSVHEPDTAHGVAVRRLCIGRELPLTATVVFLRERMCCTVSWKHCEPVCVSRPEQRERSAYSRETSM